MPECGSSASMPKRECWRRETPSSFCLKPITTKSLLVVAVKFRDALVRINLYGERDARTDQNALRCLLGDNLAGVFQAQLVPHFLGQRQCPTLVDVDDFGHVVSISHFLNSCKSWLVNKLKSGMKRSGRAITKSAGLNPPVPVGATGYGGQAV